MKIRDTLPQELTELRYVFSDGRLFSTADASVVLGLSRANAVIAYGLSRQSIERVTEWHFKFR